MTNGKGNAIVIIALVVGAAGLGVGTFSVIKYEVVEGPQGEPGLDGINGTNGDDGSDAPGGLLVKIIDPDEGETVRGNVSIRAVIYGTESYTISVKRNGTEISDSLPYEWDTTLESDGWWNISITIQDIGSLNTNTDEVLVYVDNITPDVKAGFNSDYATSAIVNSPEKIDFTYETDPEHCFNLTTDTYTAPRAGYYHVSVQVCMALPADRLFLIVLFVGSDNIAKLESVNGGGHSTLSISSVFYVQNGTEIYVLSGHGTTPTSYTFRRSYTFLRITYLPT